MANVDYFLKIEGVESESSDEKHKGEAELKSWSFSGANNGVFSSSSGGGSPSGRVALHGLKLVKRLDKSSPRLFAACCSGEHFKSAALVCRKAVSGQQEDFLTIALTSVIVSDYEAVGVGEEGKDTEPIEKVTLSFAKIEFKYKEQKTEDSSLGAEMCGGWDVVGNKKVG